MVNFSVLIKNHYVVTTYLYIQTSRDENIQEKSSTKTSMSVLFTKTFREQIRLSRKPIKESK